MRLALLVLPFLLVGCGGAGTPASVVRPAAPSGATAMGEAPPACEGLSAAPEPLVVDWRSNDRADLEVAMKESLAVVHYGCDGFRLLKACKVEGGYGFAGVRRKEDLVRLTGEDELRANLPLGSASLRGEVQRGASVDLALVVVGKQRAGKESVARGELRGACEGATHVVRSASVGAFALATSASGKVSSVAEVFGAGAGGSSAESRTSVAKDGDPKACNDAKSTDTAPPELCGSALRLELLPLAAEKKEASLAVSPSATPRPLENPCAEGLVYAGGKCTKKAATTAHRCAKNDVADCKQQCDAGNGESCYQLSLLVSMGKDGPYDAARASSLVDKACSLDVGPACASAAYHRDAKDPEHVRLLVKACDMGEATACRVAGNDIVSKRSPGARDEAFRLLERGCALHDHQGCVSYGWAFVSEGKWAEATQVLDKACAAGDGASCGLLGGFYMRCAYGRVAGMGMSEVAPCQRYPFPDNAKAVEKLGAACLDGSMPGVCQTVAKMVREGTLVKRDTALAAKFYEAGCRGRGFGTCLPVAEMYARGDGVPKDVAHALAILDVGCTEPKNMFSEEEGRACVLASDLLRSNGQPDKAATRLAWGCKHGYRRACDLHGAALERAGRTTDAKAIYKDFCDRLSDEPMCKAYVRLGGALDPNRRPRPRSPSDE